MKTILLHAITMVAVISLYRYCKALEKLRK